jgi:hypothetical protein
VAHSPVTAIVAKGSRMEIEPGLAVDALPWKRACGASM